jgi:hypothetical protein
MNTILALPVAPSAVDAATPTTYPLPQAMPVTEAVNDGHWARVPRLLRGLIARTAGIARSLRSLGPYLAIEVLLPGGSIIALALWTYRRRRAARHEDATSTAIAPSAPRARLRCVASCGLR